MNKKRQCLLRGASDRRKALAHVIGQGPVKSGIDHHRAGIGQQQGMAIGRRGGHLLCPNRASSTRLVIDQNGLPERTAQGLGP